MDRTLLAAAVRSTYLAEYEAFYGRPWSDDPDGVPPRRGPFLVLGDSSKSFQKALEYERRAFTVLSKLRAVIAEARAVAKEGNGKVLVSSPAAIALRSWVAALGEAPETQGETAASRAAIFLFRVAIIPSLNIGKPGKQADRTILVRAMDIPGWCPRHKRRPSNRELAVVSLLWGNWPELLARPPKGWSVGDIRRAEERAVRRVRKPLAKGSPEPTPKRR